MAITLTLQMNEAQQVLATMQGNLGDLTPAMNGARDMLLASVQQNFEAGGRPPWVPLRPPRTGTPLAGRGVLRNSIVAAVTPTSVELSSALPYSAIQQYGGTVNIPEIRPVRASVLRFVTAAGDVVFARRVKAHTAVIPPRPYLVAQPEDEAAIVALVEQHVVKGT
jgi:phage gpG-like protein